MYDVKFYTSTYGWFDSLAMMKGSYTLNSEDESADEYGFRVSGEQYLAATNDTAAFDSSGRLIMTSDKWWKSKACRENSTLCIPVVS